MPLAHAEAGRSTSSAAEERREEIQQKRKDNKNQEGCEEMINLDEISISLVPYRKRIDEMGASL